MSNLKQQLEQALGKDIAELCSNFQDPRSNHCAHFVSHMLGLDFTFNCREFKGGVGAPGNVRVHEVFARCPKVGNWSDADPSRAQLVFVTRKDVVDLARKRISNIPQKHIGIHCDGMIYHYSNGGDRVIKQSPEDFLETFERVYNGEQGLFFGDIPGSDLRLDVDLSGGSVTQGNALELERRGDDGWFARRRNAGQPWFHVGRETRRRSKGMFGLFLRAADYHGPRYAGDDYVNQIDHWAYLLEATGHCESKNRFNLINTYDRAKFTFGFYQLAAHTPDDNLILLFHELARQPAFRDYFPDLELRGGRLFRVKEDGSSTDLEESMATGPNGEHQLQLFMNYLNPLRWQIDEQEVLHAARLMDWSAEARSMRAVQVAVANEILQRKMASRYSRWYDLHGQSDVICAVIADIHHQGRGSKNSVRQALAEADPLQALLAVNNAQYAGRNRDLTDKIKELENRGRLGRKRYDAALNEFV